jgi:hypothetical protein
MIILVITDRSAMPLATEGAKEMTVSDSAK